MRFAILISAVLLAEAINIEYVATNEKGLFIAAVLFLLWDVVSTIRGKQ